MEKSNQELVSRVSHDIISELAPGELILFEDIEEQFFSNPGALLSEDSKKREKMLGFDLPPGTEQFITVFVIPVVFKIIDKLFSKKKPVEKLDAENMKKLREEAYNNAITMGVAKEKAELIADSFIGKMAQMGY